MDVGKAMMAAFGDRRQRDLFLLAFWGNVRFGRRRAPSRRQIVTRSDQANYVWATRG